jgi:hypothetical protein
LQVVPRLTPELAVLPWEALYDDEEQAYVCRTEPLLRHVDAPFPQLSPRVAPAAHLRCGRIPEEPNQLRVEDERQRLDVALQGLAGKA